MASFKVIGISDETTCECCGRQDLKRTVVLGRLDADKNVIEVVKFGRDCAARATLLRRTGAAMEVVARNAQADADRAELAKVHEVGEQRSVCTWVIETIGCNGGSITKVGHANGLRPSVREWAESRWPNKEIDVRKAW